MELLFRVTYWNVLTAATIQEAPMTLKEGWHNIWQVKALINSQHYQLPKLSMAYKDLKKDGNEDTEQ